LAISPSSPLFGTPYSTFGYLTFGTSSSTPAFKTPGFGTPYSTLTFGASYTSAFGGSSILSTPFYAQQQPQQ